MYAALCLYDQFEQAWLSCIYDISLQDYRITTISTCFFLVAENDLGLN